MTKLGLTLALFGVLSFGCTVQPAVEAKGSTESHLNAQQEALWPVKNGVATIPVCWAAPILDAKQFQDSATPAPTAADIEERKLWVRNIVEAQWNARTMVQFVGWQDCAAVAGNASGMAQLTPTDSLFAEGGYDPGQSHTQALGSFIQGKKAFLNLLFGDEYIYASRLVAQGKDRHQLMGGHRWNPFPCADVLKEPRADIDAAGVLDTVTATARNCLEMNALHEFGHIAGFAHEQNRDDRTNTCVQNSGQTLSDIQNTPASERGNLKLGPFDPESIMSYCRTNATAGLDAEDVTMTNTVYGGGTWGAGQNGADGQPGTSDGSETPAPTPAQPSGQPNAQGGWDGAPGQDGTSD